MNIHFKYFTFCPAEGSISGFKYSSVFDLKNQSYFGTHSFFGYALIQYFINTTYNSSWVNEPFHFSLGKYTTCIIYYTSDLIELNCSEENFNFLEI